jgi:hypothetical protein
MAQAVSRRLHTVAAWVLSQDRSCGICGGRSGTEARFLRALLSALPILFPITAPYSSAADTTGPLTAGVTSGLSLNPPQEIK